MADKPRCADCGKESGALYSIDYKGSMMGRALCKACFNAEAQKQGRPERVESEGER